MPTSHYLTLHRLADVLALIQVLAIDPHAHRSVAGVDKELPEKPRSADSWCTIADEHSEFFRVTSGAHPLSLISRHVQPRADGGGRRPLTADYVGKLLECAMALHDRQVQHRDRWKFLIPLVGVAVGSLITFLGTWLTGS